MHLAARSARSGGATGSRRARGRRPQAAALPPPIRQMPPRRPAGGPRGARACRGRRMRSASPASAEAGVPPAGGAARRQGPSQRSAQTMPPSVAIQSRPAPLPSRRACVPAGSWSATLRQLPPRWSATCSGESTTTSAPPTSTATSSAARAPGPSAIAGVSATTREAAVARRAHASALERALARGPELEPAVDGAQREGVDGAAGKPGVEAPEAGAVLREEDALLGPGGDDLAGDRQPPRARGLARAEAQRSARGPRARSRRARGRWRRGDPPPAPKAQVAHRTAAEDAPRARAVGEQPDAARVAEGDATARRLERQRLALAHARQRRDAPPDDAPCDRRPLGRLAGRGQDAEREECRREPAAERDAERVRGRLHARPSSKRRARSGPRRRRAFRRPGAGLRGSWRRRRARA